MLCALYVVYFTLPSSIEVLYIRGAPCSTELTKLLTNYFYLTRKIQSTNIWNVEKFYKISRKSIIIIISFFNLLQ